MRKVKEFFFRKFKSNLLRCVVIFFAKIYVHGLQFLSSLSLPGIRTPRVWNGTTKQRSEIFNNCTTGGNRAIYKKIYEPSPLFSFSPTLPHQLQKYALEKRYEQFVCSIPNGRISGDDTTLTSDNRILWDSNAYPGQSIYGNRNFYKRSLGSFQKQSKSIAMIAGNDTGRNYNHRITFALPKIHLFQQSGFLIDSYATNFSKKFHKESLQAAGIPSEQIIALDDDSHIQADNLYIASTTSICGNMPERATSYVRGLFLSPNSSPINTSPTRIYISRITSRKIANESDLEELLSSFGFITVVLDNLSMVEQAKLFSSAEIVIGAHGAGLTNLLFCNPGTKVIELFQPKTIFGHHYCLSQMCKLEYTYIIGKELPTKHTLPMDRDILLDINEVKAVVSQLLSS